MSKKSICVRVYRKVIEGQLWCYIPNVTVRKRRRRRKKNVKENRLRFPIRCSIQIFFLSLVFIFELAVTHSILFIFLTLFRERKEIEYDNLTKGTVCETKKPCRKEKASESLTFFSWSKKRMNHHHLPILKNSLSILLARLLSLSSNE